MIQQKQNSCKAEVEQLLKQELDQTLDQKLKKKMKSLIEGVTQKPTCSEMKILQKQVTDIQDTLVDQKQILSQLHQSIQHLTRETTTSFSTMKKSVSILTDQTSNKETIEHTRHKAHLSRSRSFGQTSESLPVINVRQAHLRDRRMSVSSDTDELHTRPQSGEKHD